MANSTAFHDLRTELHNCQCELEKVRRLLDAERVENNQISGILENVKKERENLLHQIDQLSDELDRIRGEHWFEPIVPRKPFHLLKTHASKRQRKDKYWTLINNAISNITECTRATMTLTLGIEDVHLQWTEEEMKSSRRNHIRNGFVIPPMIVQQPNHNHLHPLVTAQMQRHNKRLKITFSQKEIQKAVVTLDNQRISQPAYHELRMEMNPLMPPLNLVKEEKKSMSSHLKYYLIDGVGIWIIILHSLLI